MKRKVLEYDSIESTLLDFSKSYAELKQLNNRLMTCLHGRITVLNGGGATNIVDKIMSDNDYIKAFSEATNGRDPLSCLVLLRMLADELIESIESCHRLADKMSDRISGSGSSDNEIEVAKRRRIKYDADADVFTERLKDVVTKYYHIRSALVGKVAEESNKMESLFSLFTLDERYDAMRRYSIPQRVADSFVSK